MAQGGGGDSKPYNYTTKAKVWLYGAGEEAYSLVLLALVV